MKAVSERATKLAILTCLLLLIPTSSGQAQNQSGIEEVIVIGQLSRSAVQEQMVAVENDLYRLFNAKNGNNKFNLECRRETPTGTHFSQRVCEPRFLARARQKNNRDAAAGLDTLLTPAELQHAVSDEFAELNRIYSKLIEEDIQFAEVVGILAALRARLATLDNQ